jgi:hypothetical protein
MAANIWGDGGSIGRDAGCTFDEGQHCDRPEGLRAFENQDLEALRNLADPICVLTQKSALLWGGKFFGHEGVTSLAFPLIGATSSTLTIGETV